MLNRSPLTNADVDRLMRVDFRRTTMLAAWVICLMYVGMDLVLRVALVAEIALAQRIVEWLSTVIWLQVLVFLVAVPLIWLLCFVIDLGVADASQRSWLFRMGSLAHSRAFLGIYLALLLLLGGMALQYEIGSSSFWLIFAVLLTSCLIALANPTGEWRTQAQAAWDRLTLLFIQVPGLRRMTSMGDINRRLEPQPGGGTGDPAPDEAPPSPIETAPASAPPPDRTGERA